MTGSSRQDAGRWLTLIAILAGAAAQARAALIIDFEGPADSTIITNQYQGQGVAFNSAVILTAGASLNEFDFPPRSGVNVIAAGPGGVIQASAVGETWSSAGAFITGAAAITLDAYDSANNLLGSVSTPGANFAGGGTGFAPNLFLQVTAPGIAYVRFLGGDFTLDDLTLNPSPAAVPEPSTVAILATAVPLGLGFRWRNRRSAPPPIR